MTGPRLSIIPAGAVLDRRLKARDLQVLCLFGKHTDKNGWCCRSQVKMAREIDCARSTVQASITRLVEAGWLEVRPHSPVGEAGERDSAHEYRVVLDQPDRAEGGADISAGGADPESAGGADPESAPKNDPSKTDPSRTAGAQARGGRFEDLWKKWPASSRPGNDKAAEAIFGKLSHADKVAAVEFCEIFLAQQSRQKRPPLIVPYLKDRSFADFVNAPPQDSDGDFIIRPERPEWAPWLEDLRRKHGDKAAAGAVSQGFMIRHTRWPLATQRTAA